MTATPMPLRKQLFAILGSLAAFSLQGEPFILSDLHAGAARFSVQEISVGGAPDGFLLAGSASHHAVTIPLSLHGSPLMIGRTRIAEGQAQRAGEPVLVDDRWLVPLYNGHLAPDRFLISEMRPDGSIIDEPRMIPWQGVSGGWLAWNGRTLLLAAIRRQATSSMTDLVVRTASPNLTDIGEERVIASGAGVPRIVPADDGFIILYRTDAGLFVSRLAGSGEMNGTPHQLATRSVSGTFDAASVPDGAMVVWSEGPAPDWSVHVAKIDGSNVTEIATQIPPFNATFVRAFIRPLDGGFLLVWQPVDHIQGPPAGREISWMLLDREGNAGDIRVMDDLPGNELLLALGSNGDRALLVWQRNFFGVGIPLYGATISNARVSEPRIVSLDYTTVEDLDVASPGDGTTFAAWRETSATASVLFAGRWDRFGERLSLRSLLSFEGSLGDIAIVSGGGQTLLLWRQHFSLYGAWLAADASIRGDPFLVTESETQWTIPRAPAATWDGSRFIVIWKEFSEVALESVISRAVISVAGGASAPEVVVTPPPATSQRSYSIVNGRIASNSDGAMIAAEVRQQYFCVGPPCWSESHVGIARLDRDARPLTGTVELISSGSSPDVASDGRDFLVSWQHPEGVRARLFTQGGEEPSVDRLLFAHPFLQSTRAIWNGSEYVVGWGGPRIYLARLDRALARVRPVSAIAGYSTLVGKNLSVGELSGDAFVSWIDTLVEPEGAPAPVAEFVNEAVLVPTPPAAPTGVSLRRTDIPQSDHVMIDISWNPVPGADGYWIETYGPDVEGSSWFRTLLVKYGEAGSAQIIVRSPERVRIRAYGIGGSSEPVESSLIAARRRGVRR